MSELIPWITDAIVEILEANAPVSEWADGGIHVRRAPPMPHDDPNRRRDRYVVIGDVSDSSPEHVQVGPAHLTTDRVPITVWASGSRQVCHGAALIRKALDGIGGTAANLTIQRIFWRGTTTRDDDDASGAEQLIDAADLDFDVGYLLPT
jgi:hypothetical protein